jgi:O-antigen biosynthesis protein
LACVLFEHDVYFQSIARGLASMKPLAKVRAAYEYLRALRYELRMLRRLDRVQTCTEENKRYLLSFLPELEGRIDANLRAGIDAARYQFRPNGRQPRTMLFLGSFRHAPNYTALKWFLDHVLPRVLQDAPGAKLMVIGSDPPPVHTVPTFDGAVEMRGFVPDISEPLGRCAVFVCPILSGSGIRVKLLEAFASGIPVVSTRLGAEGLGEQDGLYCRLADRPEDFAAAIVSLFDDSAAAEAMARRAHAYVLADHDMSSMAARLEQTYRQTLSGKRRRPAS